MPMYAVCRTDTAFIPGVPTLQSSQFMRCPVGPRCTPLIGCVRPRHRPIRSCRLTHFVGEPGEPWRPTCMATHCCTHYAFRGYWRDRATHTAHVHQACTLPLLCVCATVDTHGFPSAGNRKAPCSGQVSMSNVNDASRRTARARAWRG